MNNAINDDVSLRSEIGETIRLFRKRMSKTQEEMSRWIGVSLSVYRRAEQGRTDVSLENLARVMLACGLSINDEHHVEEKNTNNKDRDPESGEMIRMIMKMLNENYNQKTRYQ